MHHKKETETVCKHTVRLGRADLIEMLRQRDVGAAPFDDARDLHVLFDGVQKVELFDDDDEPIIVTWVEVTRG